MTERLFILLVDGRKRNQPTDQPANPAESRMKCRLPLQSEWHDYNTLIQPQNEPSTNGKKYSISVVWSSSALCVGVTIILYFALECLIENHKSAQKTLECQGKNMYWSKLPLVFIAWVWFVEKLEFYWMETSNYLCWECWCGILIKFSGNRLNALRLC